MLNVTLDLSRLKLGQILIGKTNLIIKKVGKVAKPDFSLNINAAF